MTSKTTTSSWSFPSLSDIGDHLSDIGDQMIGHFRRVRINGFELLDLVPKVWNPRIEKLINTVNEMDMDEIPKGIAAAANFIQETMDELNDEKKFADI